MTDAELVREIAQPLTGDANDPGRDWNAPSL